jgi:hypothetical protein
MERPGLRELARSHRAALSEENQGFGSTMTQSRYGDLLQGSLRRARSGSIAQSALPNRKNSQPGRSDAQRTTLHLVELRRLVAGAHRSSQGEWRAANWGKGRFDLPVDDRDEHIPLPD